MDSSQPSSSFFSTIFLTIPQNLEAAISTAEHERDVARDESAQLRKRLLVSVAAEEKLVQDLRVLRFVVSIEYSDDIDDIYLYDTFTLSTLISNFLPLSYFVNLNYIVLALIALIVAALGILTLKPPRMLLIPSLR